MEMRIKGLYMSQYLRGNYIRATSGSQIKISPKAKLKNVRIFICKNSKIEISEYCHLENANIYVERGSIKLDCNCIIKGNRLLPLLLTINKGNLEIGDHSKIVCKRIWIRFGGNLSIGSYTNINEGSEIRCDEKIQIGSYNQISYNVKIWDTNTHSILSSAERRNITENKYPYFGFEETRPETKPVIIRDDCWIGENSVIFKGAHIGDACIIGYGTFIAGKAIPPKSRVITERPLRIDPL